MSKSNVSRANVRKFQLCSGNQIRFWRSLQTCRLSDNMKILEEAIERIQRRDLLGHLKGAKAILELLMSVPPSGASDICRRRSCILLDRAYEIYLSYSETSVPERLLKDIQHKHSFKEFICGEKYGLCVYIYKSYVVLRPDDVDLDHLFLCLSENDQDFNNEEALNSDMILNFDGVLKSVDTEWDRKVVKVVAGAFCSRSQIHAIPGIGGHELKNMTESVLHTISLTKELMTSAEEAVDNNLSTLTTELGEKLAKMEKRRSNVVFDWSQEKLGEMDDDMEDLRNRIEDIKLVRCPEESKKHQQRLTMMQRNMFRNIVKERRLKSRKPGGGRKEAMDELDERHLLRMIETKSVAHGRRGDEVLYTDRRVKNRDFRKIVNIHRRERGLAPLKSAVTIYNRGRAKNKRSRQAKLHKGLSLFCAKKAPKGEDNDNETTHYLRAFKRNVDRHHYVANKDESAYVLEVSSDDKAYLQPGTSTGFRSARNVKIIQPSDESKARSLPKYDFPKHMVNVTPGAYRYISKDYVPVEGGKPRKVLTSDSTYVFLRTKYFVGSSGDVWASEAMDLRHEIPHKYLVNQNDCHDKPYLEVQIMLKDALSYYIDSTRIEDMAKITESESCIHRMYEACRISTLTKTLWKAFTYGDIISDENKTAYDGLKAKLLVLSDDVTKCKALFSNDASSETVITHVEDVKSKCVTISDSIKENLPQLKTRFIESTDAGPGVSIKQHDVQVRIMQRIRIQDMDYYIRYHLANGDSSYNEVERCQSYIGDAVCDGGTVEWEHQKMLDPNTLEKLRSMSLEEIQAAEEKRMLHNARMVCKDIAAKLDGAVAPNGFMKSFTTLSKDELFFNDKKYLDMFFAKGIRKRVQSPGGYYYSELLSFLESHCHVGEKYMEFVKGACNTTDQRLCVFCAKHPWIGPKITRVPAPLPDKSLLPAYHYCDVLDTPTVKDGIPREIDDYQPRVNLKKLVADGAISLGDPDSIDSYCTRFIVSRKLVVSALEHLELLQIRKEKKKQRELLEKNKVVKYEDINWVDVSEKNKLSKLPVKTLNLYFEKHNLKDQLSLLKPEKCKYIRNHIIFKNFRDDLRNDESDDTNEESDSDDDDDEEVLRVAGLDYDSEAEEEDNGHEDSNSDDSDMDDSDGEDYDEGDDHHMDDDRDVAGIFHTTRSGRFTTTWRASDYM